jgi:hypothetical protein
MHVWLASGLRQLLERFNLLGCHSLVVGHFAIPRQTRAAGSGAAPRIG